MDLGAVLMGLLSAMVVKVAVLALTALLLVRTLRVSHLRTEKLWLQIPSEHRPRLRLLTWGLILFAVSELACGMEIYVLSGSNAVLACLHSIASAAAMGVTAVGLFRLFDWKFFHFTDTCSPCMALATCGHCTKRQTGACRFKSVACLLAMLLILAAVPPLFAPTQRMHADPGRYTLPFESLNARYDAMIATLKEQNPEHGGPDVSAFYLPEEMLTLEFRILPILGVLAGVSIACFLANREDLGVMLFLLALGNQAYVYLEVMIYGVTQRPILGFFLHESSEVLFLVLLANLLPRMFPKARGAARRDAETQRK